MSDRISAADFKAVTGYELTNLDPAAQVCRGDVVGVRQGDAVVELSYDALRTIYDAHLKVRAKVPAAPASGTAGLAEVTQRLSYSATDWVITNADAEQAYNVLMSMTPLQLNQAFAGMDAQTLNRLVLQLNEAHPFKPGVAEPTPLVHLLTKLALELAPAGGAKAGFIGKLELPARQRLQEALLQLPDGRLLDRLRVGLGREGYRLLVQGQRGDTNIGRGLLGGEVFRENVTTRFQGEYQKALKGQLPLPPKANDYVYVIGPGLFGNDLPGYLDVNERALKKFGVRADNIVRLKYNTAASSTDNARIIHDKVAELRAQGKHVVLFGHSKFGADARVAMANYPDMKEMVSGAILMQPAPSAQIAKDIAGTPALQPLVAPLLDLLGGNKSAFTSLDSDEVARSRWPGERVPTVVFASTSDAASDMLAPLAKKYYQGVYGALSDGAVPFVDQASFGGSALIAVPGMADHAHPALTISDALEHFAVQLEAGHPDEVVAGIMTRLARMNHLPALTVLARQLEKGFDTQAERMAWVRGMRAAGPSLDKAIHGFARAAGRELIDAEAMTRALLVEVHTQMAAQPATSPLMNRRGG